MHPHEATKLVAILASWYDTPAWTEERFAIFEEKILDLDFAMATKAVDDWLKTHSDKRPGITELREAVASMQLGNAAGGRLFLDHDEAWKFVAQCLGTVGQYRPFPDTHPLVKAAVDSMGWVDMCRSEMDGVLRGQFRKAYESVLARSLSESAASEGAASAPSAITPAIEQKTAQLEHERPRIGGSRA